MASDHPYSKMGNKNYDSEPSSTNHPTAIAAATPLANLSLKSVLLHDWWVSKAQPKGLAIGGYECRRQGKRMFFSAPIAKRHDATTLETVDGITIAISGLMNTSRALQNGFHPELCPQFLYGFPYDWEEYSAQYSNKESAGRGTQTNSTGVVGVERSPCTNATSFLPTSLNNLPATAIRDLLIFSAGDLQNSTLERTIFDHVVEKLSNHASPSKTGDSVITPTPGVTTRSMTRLKYHQRELSSKSSAKEAVQLSSPEAKESYCGENQGNKQAKNIPAKLFNSPENNPNLSPEAKDNHCGENQGNKQAENISAKPFIPPESNSNLSPEPKESHCGECKGNKQAKTVAAKHFIAPESNPNISSSEPSTLRQMVTRSALRGSRAATLSRQKGDVVPPSSPGAIGNLSEESVEDWQAVNLTAKSINIQGIHKTICRNVQLSTSEPSRKQARIPETRSAVRWTRSRTLNYQDS